MKLQTIPTFTVPASNPVADDANPSESLAPANPQTPVTFGGEANAVLFDESLTVNSFGVESTTTPITDIPIDPNILWGTAAAAVLGMTLAEWARIREEERQRREREEQKAENQRRRRDQLEAQQQAARLAAQDNRNDYMEDKTDRIDAADNLQWETRQETGSDKPSFALINNKNTNSDDNRQNNMIEIPPLTAEQYAALSNFNTAAQVSIFIAAEVVSVAAGYLFGGLAGAFIGAIAGIGWGVYESSCMNAIQGELDRAYQDQNGIQIWRQEDTIGLYMYGGGNLDASNDSVSLINGPLSNLYLGIMTWSMTGQAP
ncbi:MAG: hypothetical protein IT311_07285 [Anaerolineales bacterium]|nr:hypothetical protein [Anaerolineales bacterium]